MVFTNMGSIKFLLSVSWIFLLIGVCKKHIYLEYRQA
jgi:hypothetical protein